MYRTTRSAELQLKGQNLQWIFVLRPAEHRPVRVVRVAGLKALFLSLFLWNVSQMSLVRDVLVFLCSIVCDSKMAAGTQNEQMWWQSWGPKEKKQSTCAHLPCSGSPDCWSELRKCASWSQKWTVCHFGTSKRKAFGPGMPLSSFC